MQCRFFLIAMSLVAGYLVLSVPFSIVSIVRPHASGIRLLLLILDVVIFINLTIILKSSLINLINLCIIILMMIMTGGTHPGHFCCWGCNCHSLLGSQWQLKLQLACHLQPVWWFLSDSQRGCGGFVCYCCYLHVLDSAVCCGSPKALRQDMEGEKLFKNDCESCLWFCFGAFLHKCFFNCCVNLVVVHVIYFV